MEDRITMELDEYDIETVEKLITSDKFAQFLLSNTTKLSQAALILQTLTDKIEECKQVFKK